jgi:hypothetical protein
LLNRERSKTIRTISDFRQQTTTLHIVTSVVKQATVSGKKMLVASSGKNRGGPGLSLSLYVGLWLWK